MPASSVVAVAPVVGLVVAVEPVVFGPVELAVDVASVAVVAGLANVAGVTGSKKKRKNSTEMFNSPCCKISLMSLSFDEVTQLFPTMSLSFTYSNRLWMSF